MKYPRTPRKFWLTIKLGPDAVKRLKKRYKTVTVLTTLAKEFGVSRETVKKYVEPERYREYKLRQVKFEASPERNKEYAERARARKKFIVGCEAMKKYRKAQYQLRKKQK